MATYADAISGIESGGKYDALGPETKGDRAYGRYQIMGGNIPQWTKEALGTELTPEQFLANPQAQDAVFQFKFGQYVNKYGPEGAARAWFAGERGMNNPNAKDVLGTSVSDYAAKFNKGMGQAGTAPSAPMSLAPPAALPAAANAPSVPPQNAMPAYSWSPQQPQQEQPPPLSPLQLMQINYAQRRPVNLPALFPLRFRV